MIAWLVSHEAVLLGAALSLSELLGLSPSVKANSIFQLVTGWLVALKSKVIG